MKVLSPAIRVVAEPHPGHDLLPAFRLRPALAPARDAIQFVPLRQETDDPADFPLVLGRDGFRGRTDPSSGENPVLHEDPLQPGCLAPRRDAWRSPGAER